jgi:hypothetical protein
MAPLPITKHGRVLGRLMAYTPPALKDWTAYLTTPLPAPPASVKVPQAAWNILGNAIWGDCTIGAAGDSIAAAVAILVATFGAGSPGTSDAVPTAAEAVAQYQALTGAKKPGDANDTGLVISSVLNIWATAGLFGDDNIGGYAPVAINSLTEIKQAIAAYGFAYVGVNLPQSAEDQVDSTPAGKMPVWTYVGDEPIGGHCILFVGYDATYLYAYTWGMVVAVQLAWYQAYTEEIWAVLPQPFMQAGKGPEVNLAELQADIGTLDVAVKPGPKRKKKRQPAWWAAILDALGF